MSPRRIHRQLRIEELEPRIAPATVWIQPTDPNASEQGPDPGVFTVFRDDTVGDLQVLYTVGGTAASMVDYVPLGGSLTIGAGQASADVLVTPIDDAISEGNESVIVTLSTSGDYTIGTSGSAMVTIADNEVPPPFWRTFLGAGSDDYGRTVAVGPDGCIYVAGYTNSPGFPTTPGAFDTSYNGGQDGFVAKFSPDGGTLIYSTFLGGTGNDQSYGIAVDASSNAYVIGYTASSNFPTTPGAYDTSFNGVYDIFVAKLSPDGAMLGYSTFLGGAADDWGRDIAVDGSGSAYVTGYTASPDFPTTPGAYDTSFNGIHDVVVAKLSPDGKTLEYSSFIGGTEGDYPNGIAVDAGGASYVAGSTRSSDFPTTPGAYDTSFNGGTNDAFVTKLSAEGSTLHYSTFLGGTGADYAYGGVAVDASGCSYVAGGTGSSDFPTTLGAYDTSFNGSMDVFVTKLSADGSALGYSTLMGGTADDLVSGIVIEGAGNAYLTGYTYSSDFPVTPGAYDTSYNGGISDVFVATLGAGGSTLGYSTFLGGTGGDGGYAIAVDSSGSVYVAGFSGSSSFPVTPGAYDTSYNGGTYDAFVAKLDMQPVTVNVAATDPNAAEAGPDTGTFTVTRTGDTSGDLVVYYTLGGTATTGDYVALPGTLGIPAGSTSGTITVTPLDDAIIEGNETVILTLSTSGSYIVGSPSSGTVTIADNDTLPTVTMSATDPNASEPGADTGTFTVTRTGDTSGALIVGYTVSGTATSGADYQALSGSVTFGAGQTSANIVVTPIDDAVSEGDESVIVTLSTSGDYVLGTSGSAMVTIADNEVPPPFWRTFLGAGSDDYGNAMVVGTDGCIYVTGGSWSPGFPTTPGAYDTTFNGGGSDVFVAKFSPDGTTLIYSTFLGGTGDDSAYGITVDGAGFVYVAGNTYSSDFPTTPGAFDTSYGGGISGDAFVTKLSPDGSTLVYSTFLGGSGTDYANAIALDASGGVYVTGDTYSADFPTTPGAYDTSFNGGSIDVFVTKLSADGSTLVYSTFLGGTDTDCGYGIAVDAGGRAYLTGETNSSDFPTTPGAYDTSLNSSVDVFVTRLSADGAVLEYSTFLGGTQGDSGRGIAVDGGGNAYVAGFAGPAFPTTPGAFDTSHNGSADAFVTKLSADGSALVYSTLLGGTGDDYAYALSLDGSGSAYVSGHSDSPMFPTTPGAFDTGYNGNDDAFVTKLSADGAAVVYSTFLGGGLGDRSNAIALDPLGAVYVAGYTGSPDFPVTPGAYDTSYNGGQDVFVTKLDMLPVTVNITATDPNASETGPDTGTFTVTRTGDTSAALVVGYTVSGTATNGPDYQPLLGSVTIGAGQASANILVTPSDDILIEGNETVILTLSTSGAYVVGSPNSGTVTIADNDTLPTVTMSATDPNASEPGADTGTFTVTRTGDTSGALTVSYTINGTANAEVDYVPLGGSVTIGAGQASANIVVTPIDDAIYEGNESVILTLSTSGSYVVGTPNSGTVTIADDEAPDVRYWYFLDGDGSLVQFKLFGPGALSYTLTNGQTTGAAIQQVTVDESTPATSFEMYSFGGAVPGTTFQNVVINKAATAGAALSTFRGAEVKPALNGGMTVGGSVGRISFNEIDLPSTINVQGSLTSFYAPSVGDGLGLQVAGTLGDFIAKTVGNEPTLSVGGDMARLCVLGAIGTGGDIAVGGSLSCFYAYTVGDGLALDVIGDLNRWAALTLGGGSRIGVGGAAENLWSFVSIGNASTISAGVGVNSFDGAEVGADFTLEVMEGSVGALRAASIGDRAKVSVGGDMQVLSTPSLGTGGNVTVWGSLADFNASTVGDALTLNVGGDLNKFNANDVGLAPQVSVGGNLDYMFVNNGSLAGARITAGQGIGGIYVYNGSINTGSGLVVADGTTGIGVIDAGGGGLGGVISAPAGDIGLVRVNGDAGASATTSGVLGAYSVCGGSPVSPRTLGGTVNADTIDYILGPYTNMQGASIRIVDSLGGALSVQSMNGATLSAGHINNVTVSADVVGSKILSGYDIGADMSLGTADDAPFVGGWIWSANIDTIRVGGNMSSTSIAANVHPGADSKFGTGDDQMLSPMLQGQIGSVIVTGSLTGSGAPAENYGIVSHQTIDGLWLAGSSRLLPWAMGNISVVENIGSLEGA